VAAAVADATDRTTALAGPSESRADRWQVADGWRLGERAWEHGFVVSEANTDAAVAGTRAARRHRRPAEQVRGV
jgi:hypothetical protein